MSNFKKFIFILIDGVPFSIFNDLIEKGQLPNIKKHIIDRGCLKKAVSVFPTTTGPAFIPFFTGLFPGTANIPGIRWLSKKDYHKNPYRSPGLCSYIGLDGMNFNKDLPDSPTIFNYFKNSANIYNLITKGVSKDLTSKQKIMHYSYSYLSHNWSYTDSKASNFLLNAIEKDFECIVCLYPGVDEYAHLHGIKNSITKNEYINIDNDLGRIFNLLKEKNIYDETLVVISSDHGLTDTHTHIDVEKILENNNLKCLYFPKIWKKNVRCASMVSGNGMVHLYFKESKNCWGKRIHIEDIHETGIVNIFKNIDGIELIIGINKDENIEIINKFGKGILSYNNNLINYTYEGSDPIELNKKYKNLSFEKILEETIDSKYPDIFIQLIQIFKSERTGDLIITAKPGYDLRAKYEINKHHATHGALNAEQILVPFLTNYKINKKCIRTVDMFPSVLKLLKKNIPHKIDGESYV